MFVAALFIAKTGNNPNVLQRLNVKQTVAKCAMSIP